MDEVWSAVVARWFTATRHGVPVDCWALWDGGQHLAVGQTKADVTYVEGHMTELRLMVNFTEPNPYEPQRFQLADFVVIHTLGLQPTKTFFNTGEGPIEYDGGVVWTPSTYVAGTEPVDSPSSLLVQFRSRLGDVLLGSH